MLVGAQESLGSWSVGTRSRVGWRGPGGGIRAWHSRAPPYMVIGRIHEGRRSIPVTRDTKGQSLSIINSTLQMERLSYGEINWFTWAQPASYLMSGTRPDFMFPGSELRVFVLDLCTCWPVPADGHFDKSSQLEADVIMVYTETCLPEFPNGEVALLRFPRVCGGGRGDLCLYNPHRHTKKAGHSAATERPQGDELWWCYSFQENLRIKSHVFP